MSDQYPLRTWLIVPAACCDLGTVMVVLGPCDLPSELRESNLNWGGEAYRRVKPFDPSLPDQWQWRWKGHWYPLRSHAMKHQLCEAERQKAVSR